MSPGTGASRGISPARITTISYGKERPIALGSDDASWAQNRRAVTIVDAEELGGVMTEKLAELFDETGTQPQRGGRPTLH